MKKLYSTERMILRLADSKFAGMAADFFWRNKDEFEKYEERRPEEFFLPEFQKIWLDIQRQKAEQGEWYPFYLFEKEEPYRLIGTLTISQVQYDNGGSAVIGYRIDKIKQGQGLGSEAADEGTKIGFRELHLQKMMADVMPQNLASLRVLEKCGYKKERYLKEYLKINGKYEDHIRMVITRMEKGEKNSNWLL